MRYEWVLRVRWILLAVLACELLAMSASEGPVQEPSSGSRRAMDAFSDPIDYRMADLSLAVREQVDFLLTPALLVQEAVSDDIVLTYPEE